VKVVLFCLFLLLQKDIDDKLLCYKRKKHTQINIILCRELRLFNFLSLPKSQEQTLLKAPNDQSLS